MDQMQHIIEYLINRLEHGKKCICCGQENVSLCLLNNNIYICVHCAEKIIELFGRHGEPININISNISPKMAKKLGDMIEGNIKSKCIVYNMKKEEENNVDTI